MSSLPPTYAILPISYPSDTIPYNEVLHEIFSTDPNALYIRSRIKNPETNTLRRHMRLARFKNNIEGLALDTPGTDTLYMKLVHLPTNTIVGAGIWQLPARTTPDITTPDSTKQPYPLLPPNTQIPAEDASISTLGPAMDTALETITSRIPQLGSTPSRSQHWWYLTTLGIVASHQGKRFGQALVDWGVEQALADAANRPEAGIRGVWVVATEAGRKTYENAGFVSVGGCRMVYGDGRGGLGMRFDVGEGIEGVESEGGQDFRMLVREF